MPFLRCSAGLNCFLEPVSAGKGLDPVTLRRRGFEAFEAGGSKRGVVGELLLLVCWQLYVLSLSSFLTLLSHVVWLPYNLVDIL